VRADVLRGAPDRGALAVLELGGQGGGDFMRVKLAGCCSVPRDSSTPRAASAQA
jgi:hypothetical protein